MKKTIKWHVEEASTGPYRSFHKRGFPRGEFQNGKPALHLVCADNYISAKTIPNSPIKVLVAQYHPENIRAKFGAFSWRTIAREFATVAEAKAAGEKFLSQHPEFYENM